MTDFNKENNFNPDLSSHPITENPADNDNTEFAASENTTAVNSAVNKENTITSANEDTAPINTIDTDSTASDFTAAMDTTNKIYEDTDTVDTNNTYTSDSSPVFSQNATNPNPLANDIRYSPVTYQHIDGAPCYTENIKKKPKNRGKSFVAAVLAITILNLSVMGGMFYMGHKLGKEGRSVASKQELMDKLKTNGTDTAGATQTAATGNELSTTEIAKKVGPAVVGIKSVIQGQMSIFGTTQSSESEGSGIIISEDGYIVTNNHVVDGASSISVQLNTGTEIEAKLIGKDSQTDLAVIKIEPTEELTVATLGDSTNIEVGERVVAIGNPMGLEFFGTVTQGIVSGVNRSITVDNRTLNVIQTDAAINSGNSGGALINRFGEVIGINSVKVASSGVEGMGFAIPSSEFKPIISDLLEHGYVKGRPVIGISTRDVTEYMARSYSWPQGVQVMEISSESARNAGFAQGDIITEVDGQKITDTESLNTIKNTHNPGDVLNMTVYKYASGKTENIQVTLSEQLPG